MTVGSNFTVCLKEVLRHEGGFVNHPKDPGGMTNLGVTRRTYEDWVGHPVNEATMRKLTPGSVAPLYKRQFWDALRCDRLPKGVDLCVFDFGVNAGVNRAARYLQLIVGAEKDGKIGPATINLVVKNKLKPDQIIRVYQLSRRSFYKKLPKFPVFGKGWLRRVDEVEKVALKMVERKGSNG